MSAAHGKNYHADDRHTGQTLATALRGWLTGKSWGDVKKLIAQRRVAVNGNLCVDAGRKLRATDVVKVLEHPAAAPVEPHDVRVRYFDRHVVVVEKPPGVTSTRHHEERDWPKRRKQMQPTLDEMLPHVLARVGRRPVKGGRTPPVRAVHRLDRETSGLMVFARSPEAAAELMQQFRQHSTQRRYLAIALGDVAEQTIESRLVRDRGDGRRGSTTLANVGKHAVTHVRPLESLPGYTLLECRLETGRTHQIRIHLAEAGHPLCGEKVYNQPYAARRIVDNSRAPRVALHAAELGFVH
ncbi:MAG: RluA family pseudouridine synthase, partial [Planctomycetales bacterium]|nr:RluA family pseudouridine synthase [Planctomycetales bacterium]